MSLRTRLVNPASKRECNRELFTVIAPEYDRVTRPLSLFGDQRWKRIMVQNVPFFRKPVIVDFACGTGDLTGRLAARFADGYVVGADITPAMLRLAKARESQIGTGRVGCSLADMCFPPFKSGSADIVTGGYALRNAPDLPVFLHELHRILRPGGVACFLDFSRPANRLAGRVQYAVLRLWGGLFGLLLHRRPEVYGYIADSLRLFPDRKSLESLIRTCGFEEVATRTFYAGTMAIVTFRRPGDKGIL
jgi:demethylmenaquinone methyltransferase/2-methoxy-6-polyprenyl-1,4-benzoquinol methylase